ncbi:bifunctional diaminohydroxyphosphoribosylaminopyrimidine deaminase/5-amino-6-(5-phosphoribosylamino)uracil reductase RibD [Anaerovorax odorimutans]|uniref:Riboflavin biosynthesis protein RibD n=1 Tax=Anaerovorax odorimutans TaxID=109327 RepID=A0ABT1RKC5_9FIRM|nr:bifunctional diaminohydroxyphosphoribosylaminopyrimidine deaminase/5-amino-6-(5-phosphoribosylamino)uracil reductase RibD [Anaerovorax odorimutans]MCQ4635628.1 bifunctional diaminohydroxyphosphoribosylaminopyrimidine deaminase/5-amino-6-(5-phosphoribosylamino)uracil reductase RibD [Anaerovorax odorimutans]
MTKEEYMRYALELAQQGRGRTSPNPLVGAVIVKGGRIIGEGWHKKCGENHAEINAFEDAAREGHDVRGAEMYVTLEPCSHYGKTPPCAKTIIEKGIKKVYVGTADPNPLVAGQGLQMMEKAGIEVEMGILEEECRSINEIFLKYITAGKPFVVMKTAMTLDGKIASHTGDSKWVSGDEARRIVQEMRNSLTGIMVGIGTVLADDPELTCRLEGGRDPLRIIVDSHLRIPLTAKVLKDENYIIAATADCDSEKRKRLGERVLIVKSKNGQVDLEDLMTHLGDRGIDSILLEGGGTLNEAALKAGIVDRVVSFIAPKIIGGRKAKTPVEGEGFEKMSQAISLKDLEIQKIGDDLMIQAVPERK